MLVEMILDKKMLIKSIQLKWVKIICLLPIHHSLTMQHFVRTCIKKIGAKIKNRPKALTKNEKLGLKDQFPSKRDYGSYFIERDVKKENDFILQLCPFVKLDG